MENEGNKPMKAYELSYEQTITTGTHSFSDDAIAGITADAERAKRWVAAHPGNAATEIELDPADVAELIENN
jgi:hypothetical protein